MTEIQAVERLTQRFPDIFSVEGWSERRRVPPGQHLEVARFLKDELGFTLYVTVVASHWPGDAETPETFQVATVLRRPSKPSLSFSWRVELAAGEPITTLYPLFAGADWQEREQFDLVGVRFEGHPDMRRLMLPEDWVGHPLRKDYAIDTPQHPWR